MRTELMDLNVLDLAELDSRVMLCNEQAASGCCCCCCCSCCSCTSESCDEIERLG